MLLCAAVLLQDICLLNSSILLPLHLHSCDHMLASVAQLRVTNQIINNRTSLHFNIKALAIHANTNTNGNIYAYCYHQQL